MPIHFVEKVLPRIVARSRQFSASPRTLSICNDCNNLRVGVVTQTLYRHDSVIAMCESLWAAEAPSSSICAGWCCRQCGTSLWRVDTTWSFIPTSHCRPRGRGHMVHILHSTTLQLRRGTGLTSIPCWPTFDLPPRSLIKTQHVCLPSLRKI